jgi:hypothetical protein
MTTARREVGERLWLTEEALQRAILALKRRREEAGSKWKESAQDKRTKEVFWQIARSDKPLDWIALLHNLQRSRSRGSRTWRGTNDLAAHLLGVDIAEITTTEPPEDSGPVQIGLGDDSKQLRVSYPKTIANHTAVILGQLPGPALFGAIFVKPRDGEDAWYPQCGGKHNPLQVGRAFACLAHFGNPDFVSYFGDPPAFDVQVYAIRSPWPHGSDRLTTDELNARIAHLEPVGKPADFFIDRISPVQEMAVLDAAGKVLWMEGPKTIRLETQITISWKGQPDATIEIRAGVGDRELIRQRVRSPLTLTAAAPREPVGAKVIHLPGVKKGLYRVRLYPLKYTFVDSPYEWWLQAPDSSG